MFISRRLEMATLLLGDLILFYGALFLMLIMRYQLSQFADTVALHKQPFFYIHLLWILIFYINGLYDIRNFPSRKKIMAKALETMAVSGIFAVLIFYLIPSFEITPKTNLIIDLIFVTLFIMLWRRFFWSFVNKKGKVKILFFGASEETENFANYLKECPYLGYEPAVILKTVDHNLIELIKKYGISLIVASQNILEDKNAAKRLYEALPLGVSIMSFPNFYEVVMEKIPVSSVKESWFLENLVEIKKRVYEFFKRIFDAVFSLILLMPTLALLPLIGLAIKIESPGPIFYRQKRVGKDGKIFEIIKFRSMYAFSPDGGAEKSGAQWASSNDERVTKIGRILRKTRLDELPQLFNVLKGELSFIGPRPERPEFVESLQKQIPHYAMRHLIKPGLSGWAQIKFPYGASVEDALKKLQYDLYYIKNRSLLLDAAIALRTLALMIKGEGR